MKEWLDGCLSCIGFLVVALSAVGILAALIAGWA